MCSDQAILWVFVAWFVLIFGGATGIYRFSTDEDNAFLGSITLLFFGVAGTMVALPVWIYWLLFCW